MIYIAFIAFGFMIIQSGLTYLQYKNYQKAVDNMRKKGRILGIGLRKGGFNLKGGSIVILALDRDTRRVVGCKRLDGIALWKRFKDISLYNGLSLSEIREVGIVEDLVINQQRRKKEPYSPELIDKKRKKGALIQAIEALDQRLKYERSEALNQKRRMKERQLSEARRGGKIENL
ncbi:MAG: transcriptional regulator GutM [Eubacteriaceae bacterium]